MKYRLWSCCCYRSCYSSFTPSFAFSSSSLSTTCASLLAGAVAANVAVVGAIDIFFFVVKVDGIGSVVVVVVNTMRSELSLTLTLFPYINYTLLVLVDRRVVPCLYRETMLGGRDYPFPCHCEDPSVRESDDYTYLRSYVCALLSRTRGSMRERNSCHSFVHVTRSRHVGLISRDRRTEKEEKKKKKKRKRGKEDVDRDERPVELSPLAAGRFVLFEYVGRDRTSAYLKREPCLGISRRNRVVVATGRSCYSRPSFALRNLLCRSTTHCSSFSLPRASTSYRVSFHFVPFRPLGRCIDARSAADDLRKPRYTTPSTMSMEDGCRSISATASETKRRDRTTRCDSTASFVRIRNDARAISTDRIEKFRCDLTFVR